MQVFAKKQGLLGGIDEAIAFFAHLAMLYLGTLARRSRVMTNVRRVVEAARGKPILFFPARHDHWLVQTGEGWAAHVAGAIGVSTDAQASWWGGRGGGTIPHSLIAAYGGDTVAAARAFCRRYGDEINVIALVDFDNASVATSVASPTRSARSSGACASTPPSASSTARWRRRRGSGGRRACAASTSSSSGACARRSTTPATGT